jgi:hypothetical protein
MKVEGQCHCGRIRYEAEVDPAKVIVCHCTDCQKFSGAPYRASVPAAAADFILHGQPSHYIKTADSGSKRVQAFCPNCGTALYAANAVDPQVFNLRTGSIKQRRELVPSRQIWRRSALPWACDLSGLESFEDQGPRG